MTACACRQKQCLLCKHSRTGDACDKDENIFTKSSLRDILDKAIVYKVKIQYLNDQLEKAKNKDDNEVSLEIKKMRKSLKESIRIKAMLDQELELLRQEENISNDSMFNIQTIKIKEIIQD